MDIKIILILSTHVEKSASFNEIPTSNHCSFNKDTEFYGLWKRLFEKKVSSEALFRTLAQ